MSGRGGELTEAEAAAEDIWPYADSSRPGPEPTGLAYADVGRPSLDGQLAQATLPRLISLQAGEPVADTASRLDYTVRRLIALAEEGVFPPQVGDWSEEQQGWFFHPEMTKAEASSIISARACWLPNLPDDLSEATTYWLRHYERQSRGVRPSRRHIVSWCRVAAPDALHADPAQFAFWCSADPEGAHDIADKWWSLWAWYRALKTWGVACPNPTRRTKLAVVADAHPADDYWTFQAEA